MNTAPDASATARRTTRLVLLLIPITTLALTGCGGDGAAPTTTTTAATTTTVDPTEAVAQVFTAFFDPGTSDEARVALLEDPKAMRPLYERARNDPTTGPLLAQIGVRVDAVRMTSDATAEVDYVLLLDGAPATPGTLLGRAVVVDGQWRMADTTLCSLLALSDPSYSAEPACAVG